MVFMPDHIPAPDGPKLDPETRYVADLPFDAKQAKTTTRRHRWFEWIPISIPGALYVNVPGLPAGQTQRIFFDHKPDFIQISISGQTTATGRVMVFPGEPGGFGIGPLGPGGKVTMPAPEGGILSLVNVGSTPTFGVVVAIAGYTDPGIDVSLGS